MLPYLYGMSGYRAVGRTLFSDEWKPGTWDYEVYKKFNNGKPNVVAMIYDPEYGKLYVHADGNQYGPDDYDKMISDQGKFVTELIKGQPRFCLKESEENTHGFYSQLERTFELKHPGEDNDNPLTIESGASENTGTRVIISDGDHSPTVAGKGLDGSKGSHAVQSAPTKPDKRLPGSRLEDLKPEEIRDIARSMGIDPGAKGKTDLMEEIREKLRQKGEDATALPGVTSKGVVDDTTKGIKKPVGGKAQYEGKTEASADAGTPSGPAKTGEGEAANSDRLIEQLKESITNKRGEKRITSDVSELAVSLIRQGYDTFDSFCAEAKARLGDLHDAVKPLLLKAFAKAKKVVRENPSGGGEWWRKLTIKHLLKTLGAEMRGRRSVGGAKKLIQKTIRTVLEEEGIVPGDLNDPKLRYGIVRALMEDVIGSRGEDFFSSMDLAREIAGKIWPELRNDPNKMYALHVALAISSHKLDLKANYKFAVRQLEHFLEKGRFLEEGQGEAAAQMALNFTKMNEFLDMYGPDTLRKFMNSEFTVKELKDAGWRVTGELEDVLIHGANILGPKIGAFLQNLLGNLDPLTIDRWVMRIVGRVSGDLTKTDSPLFGRHVDDLINSVIADPREGGVNWLATRPTRQFKEETGIKMFTRENLKDPYVAEHFARRVKDRFGKIAKESGASGDLEKPNVVLAAERLIKEARANEAPRGGKHRNQIRSIFEDVRNGLREEHGVDLRMANVQGILWCLEPDFYGKLGACLKHTGQFTFVDFLRETAETKGVGLGETEEAYRSRRQSGGGAGSQRGARGEGGGLANDAGGNPGSGGEHGEANGKEIWDALPEEERLDFLAKNPPPESASRKRGNSGGGGANALAKPGKGAENVVTSGIPGSRSGSSFP
jgi:hypothetical protein